MANTDSTSSIVVAIVAIVAVITVAYVGLMFLNKAPADNTEGTTAGIDLSIGNDNPPPPTNAQ